MLLNLTFELFSWASLAAAWPERHPREVAFQAAMPPFVGAFFPGFPFRSTTGATVAWPSASSRLSR